MNTSQEDDQKEPNFIRKLIYRFVEGYAQAFVDDIRKQVESTFRKMGIKTMSALIVFVGIIFLLISLIVLLNDLINSSPSIGFAIVGALTAAVGLFIGTRK